MVGSLAQDRVELVSDRVPDPWHERQLGGTDQREILEEGRKIAARREVRGPTRTQGAVEQAAPHHVAHRQEVQGDRGRGTVIAPVRAEGLSPGARRQPLGIHRSLRCARTSRGVDEQGERVVVGRGGGGAGRQVGAALHEITDRRELHGVGAVLAEGVSRSGYFFAVVVELEARVEDDDPRDGGSGEGQFDGVAEMVDGRGDEHGFGFGDDGCQRREC